MGFVDFGRIIFVISPQTRRFRREDSKVFAKYHFFVDTVSNLC